MQSFLGRSILHRFSSTNRLCGPHVTRALFASNAFESADDFEERIFGNNNNNNNNNNDKSSSSSVGDSFFKKLDKLDRLRDRRPGNVHGSIFGIRGGSGGLGLSDDDSKGIGRIFDDTLNDGMDGKLKRAATATDFDYDSEEVEEEGYKFRPDATFEPGMTYELKDLDLTKPSVRTHFRKKPEFQTTTDEVLRKADFRKKNGTKLSHLTMPTLPVQNVRFLANFITEAGILKKRSMVSSNKNKDLYSNSQIKISAKAQRKVAREIKTARAFGLMPFTTMGTKAFAFGRNMEPLDDDYEFRPTRRLPMGAGFVENNPFGDDSKGFGKV
ncbi:hypothetical protein ACFE04_015071 [Oxalis oulophora]